MSINNDHSFTLVQMCSNTQVFTVAVQAAHKISHPFGASYSYTFITQATKAMKYSLDV